MARMFKWVGVAALGLVMTGCISQEKYNALKLDRDQLAERLSQADADARTAKAEAELLKNQLAAFNGSGNSKDALLSNLTTSNAQLQKDLEELNRKYMEALNRGGGQMAALPQELSNALTDFARQYPDLVEFDSARGIVKFKSDVTFALGDATLTPKAREVISRFSSILNSPAAANYELVVAGHTDSTRVSNPATISAGHKDNWYLSAHRAISVGEELMSQSVNAQRLGVTGYADMRPVASNASDSGRAANRRVEVLILPTTVRGGAGMAASSTMGQPVKASNTVAPSNINKDAVVPQQSKPIFTK